MDLPAAEQTEAFAEILREIQAEIALAQERGVYAAPRVQLLAVSKTVDCGRAAACWQAGQALGLAGLAENKVQELAQKCAQLASGFGVGTPGGGAGYHSQMSGGG